MQQPIRGLVAAPFTPFHPDGSLNLDVIPAYARHLADTGVVAAFICGTTGEGASLTTAERKLVAEKWLESAPKELSVIIHVGHACTEDSRDLAYHAQHIGGAAVAAMAPYFFKPRNTGELVSICSHIAAAAPALPFYYYHIPSMTGVSLSVTAFCREAASAIPNLAGVKFTFEDLVDYAGCFSVRTPAGGSLDILFGRDELMPAAWDAGARGFIGSSYNFAAPLFGSVLEALASGDSDRAMELHGKAVRLIDAGLAIGVPGTAAFKAIMPMIGIDCGPVRPALAQPAPEQIARLRNALELNDFFTSKYELAHS
ncbi:dihydrodipicolinate synthetase [Verrucomicrobia bacterium LW23]|nr:dihydrodipicolinate synthetase [Verrucomicrobia bacterium LW23]